MKQLVRSLRTRLGKVGRPPAGDAITQMILGIFSRDAPESKARAALDRLRGLVVDYNELRVVPAIEMTEMVGALSDARLKCEDLSRALNRVFAFEHEVSLERLRELSRKEVVEYLDGVDGLDAYSRARVRLLGLQQHAVPLDEAMWAYARKERIVDRNCPLDEAQAFLERRIPDGDALEFVKLVKKQAWVEMAAAVRNREVERIVSIPPDRTARNMLQMVVTGRSVAAAAQRPADQATSRAAGSAPAKAKRAARPGKAKARKPKKTSRKRAAAKPARKPKRKSTGKPRARKPRPAQKKKKSKSPTRRKRTSRAGAKRRAGKATARKAVKRIGRSARRAKSA
jgi:hypothetical protein